MKIVLLHPITHGVEKTLVEYSRGEYQTDDANKAAYIDPGTAAEFLKQKDAHTGAPIAERWRPAKAVVGKAEVKTAEDAKDDKKDSKKDDKK